MTYVGPLRVICVRGIAELLGLACACGPRVDIEPHVLWPGYCASLRPVVLLMPAVARPPVRDDGEQGLDEVPILGDDAQRRGVPPWALRPVS